MGIVCTVVYAIMIVGLMRHTFKTAEHVIERVELIKDMDQSIKKCMAPHPQINLARSILDPIKFETISQIAQEA